MFKKNKNKLHHSDLKSTEKQNYVFCLKLSGRFNLKNLQKIAIGKTVLIHFKQSQQQPYPWLLPSAWIHTHLE
uniref:Uncharacterized protein n=1 Tax=Anser brachyrhynchus TaxID=132585 RepID=A0A8B9BJ54_9AVES